MSIFIFTLAFLNEKNRNLYHVKSTLKHTLLTFTKIKLCKRTEVYSESMALPSWGGMQRPVSRPAPVFTKILESQKVLDFLRPLKTQIIRKKS